MTPEQKGFIASLDQDGTLAPEDVLAAAMPEESPIHSLFEWDDAVAGHRHRMDQARRVIATIRVEIINSVTELRNPVYVHDPRLGGREGGFVKVGVIAEADDAALAALQAELDRIASLVERTRLIARTLGKDALCQEKLEALVAKPTVPKVVVARRTR